MTQMPDWRIELRNISKAFGIPADEIVSDCRRPGPSHARFALYKSMRDRGLPYTVIGRLIGRDYSTVVSGCKRADAMLGSDVDFVDRFLRARAHSYLEARRG